VGSGEMVPPLGESTTKHINQSTLPATVSSPACSVNSRSNTPAAAAGTPAINRRNRFLQHKRFRFRLLLYISQQRGQSVVCRIRAPRLNVPLNGFRWHLACTLVGFNDTVCYVGSLLPAWEETICGSNHRAEHAAANCLLPPND